MLTIRSVLIANRGEIAARIAKTLSRLGIMVYALESDLDRGAYHTRFADQVLKLNGESIRETYLNAEQILALVKSRKIDAVHPGYGFLSENAEFARACEEAGVIFIGPDSLSIAAMGSKARAKDLMIKAKVPTIPGYQGEDQSLATLAKEAKKLKYPVLIKASAGGGGKGMRIVRSDAELNGAIEGAKSEALKSFGDERLIIEKFIENPRHIEFQIFGDSHGNLIHLGERECSIQRRHQKIIEESPSTALDDDLRARMAAAAMACGRTLSYKNAGTVEFVVNDKGEFYFLEVNTRLQVEHPVTELCTGFDLVEWQVRVAEGKPLPVSQDNIIFRGHAIECRLYAEDAENKFLPSTGKILFYEEPAAPFLRVDSGVGLASEISIHFDPMIAKVIAVGATRDEAISRLKWALENYPVLGVKTNAALLLDVLSHREFLAGRVTTHFLDEHFATWHDEPQGEELILLVNALDSARSPDPLAGGLSSDFSNGNLYKKMDSFRVGQN